MSSRSSVDRAPAGVREVMGLIIVGESDLSVPRSWHINQFTFFTSQLLSVWMCRWNTVSRVSYNISNTRDSVSSGHPNNEKREWKMQMQPWHYWKNDLKKFRLWTAFEPTTFALPVQCSTNWAIKATWERSSLVVRYIAWPRNRGILLPEGTYRLEEICQFPVLVRAWAVTPPASETNFLHPPVASSLALPF